MDEFGPNDSPVDDPPGGDPEAPSADEPIVAATTRIRLDGERFENKRIPVEVTEELRRYGRLIAKVAAEKWRAENPDRKRLPAHFEGSFHLVITGVDDGSAIPLLEVSSSAAFARFYEAATSEVDASFAAIVANVEIDQSWLIEEPDFRAFGQTLEPGEAIELRPATEEVVRYTPEVRERRFPKKQQPRPPADEAPVPPKVVAGRLTAINAEKRTFTLITQRKVALQGKYQNPEMTKDLRDVLNTSSLAPLVRVTGQLAVGEDGQILKIEDVETVELFATEREPWTRRLVELGELAEGWSEAGTGSPVEFAALDAARELLRTFQLEGRAAPGIAPMEDGGVVLEWGSPELIVNVEISPDVEYSLFRYRTANREVASAETIALPEAVAFLLREVQ